MTPEQCAVVRDNLSGWMLADAICGDDSARRALAQSVYFTSHTRDGQLSWFQCSSTGVAVGYERTPVATWREIGAHLATLPRALAAETRAAYAEHRRLWSVYCHSGIAADRTADDEHLRDVLGPLLDQALTYRAPVAATQPDIFDLLAEAS